MTNQNTETTYLRKIAELEAEIARLREISQKDKLTGCLRRETFMELIEERRKFGYLPKNATLCLLDVDFFKRVNDTHGHIAGDRVLSHIGKLLNDQVPEGSLVCRMGGEEFVVLLPLPLNEALKVAEGLRSTLESSKIKLNLQNTLSVTASFGLSQWDTDSEILAATALADGALYRAKNNGRNQVAA